MFFMWVFTYGSELLHSLYKYLLTVASAASGGLNREVLYCFSF